MKVFDRIQSMSKDELQRFLYAIYLNGVIDSQIGSPLFADYKALVDLDEDCVSDVLDVYSDHYYQIEIIDLKNLCSHQLPTIFCENDALAYINEENLGFAVKIDNYTYAVPEEVYKLIPIN